MNLFPFFTDITGKTFLIVGGGAVAREKAESLLRFDADILLVAEETEIDDPRIRVERRAFELSDLDRADFVLAATSDRALNIRISAECHARRIPVNAADAPELCTFVMPAIVKHGDLTAAVSTNGKSPAAAAWTRRAIERALPDGLPAAIEILGGLRETVHREISSQPRRKKAYQAILDLLLSEENPQDCSEKIQELIRSFADEEAQAGNPPQQTGAGADKDR